MCRRENSSVLFGGDSVMVWSDICGQQQTDLIVTDGNLTAYLYLYIMNIHAIETFPL